MKKTLNACFGGWFGALNSSAHGRVIFSGTTMAAAFLLLIGSARGAILPGHVPAGAAQATLVGRMPGSNHMSLSIGLPLRDREGLTNLLHDLYDPTSTNFHHFLKPADFTGKFGATEDDYSRLIAFAEAHGLRTTRHDNRMLLVVDGSVANIEEALQVKMHVYHHPVENRDFFAPDTDPTIPDGLSVTRISGLDNYVVPHPMLHKMAATSGTLGLNGSGPGGSYMGSDFRKAYAPGVTLNGTGQTIGLLQFDSGYFTNDIAAYEQLNNLPNVPIIPILLDGYDGGPGIGNDEVSLDIEMVISMAPGISKVFVYEGSQTDDILNRMATDDLSSQLSASWTYPIDDTTEQIFQEFAAQGQSFFNASGDSDAWVGTIPTPCDDPNITIVGGTTLTMNGTAVSYASEKVWNWGDGVGGGGGISTVYPIPSWQQGISMALNGGSATMRNIPDVALTADNVWVISGNGSSGAFGGTSCATPLWAGFTALMNQQAVQTATPALGFVNPAIYGIGTGPAYNLCFHDVTLGDDTWAGSPNEFFAVAGYDLATGWGTPTGSNLINTLVPLAATPVLVVSTNFLFGGNGNGIIDFNECNNLLVVVANIGTSNATTVIAQLSTTTPGVAIGQSTVAYSNIAVGASVTNASPFQISTSPSFICGTPVNFILTLKSDQVTDTRGFTIASGEPGQPVRFDSTNFVPVSPGSSCTSSLITVSNVTTALNHVTVSAFVEDQFDAGLTLQLISPDGTTVTLVQNNGNSGQNYGMDCSDGDRTTFDDSAATSISAGFAPYVGTFQPVSPLAAFTGKSGTNINGAWQLHAVDQFNFDVGVIDCWSLILTPAACVDGGGQCPGVDLALGMTGFPNPVQLHSNLTYTISVTNNGPDTATSVAVSQRLPDSATFISATPSQGFTSQTGDLLTCNLGTLVVGGTATLVVVVSPNIATNIVSTASVGAQQEELDPFNNTATVTNIVRSTSADLGVVLTANPNPVLLGGVLTYTATVVNNGASGATNIMVTNTLPLNVGILTTASSQGSVSTVANLVVASLGELDPGSNATVTITVQPLVLGSLTATSSVSSSVTDPFSANNSSSVTVSVAPAADLALTLTGPSSVVLSSNITYQLNVVNQGPSLATSVTIKNTLPANVNFISATNNTPGGAVPTFAGGIITCLVSNLAVNAGVSITIVGGTTALSNAVPINVIDAATVSANQADAATNNNSATLSTLVTFPTINVVNAGFLLQSESFLPADGMIEPGETVTMLLRLQNLGNISTANNLTATLLATNGVTPVGSQVQNYGTLGLGSAAVGRPFTFTASGASGGTITVNLLVQNGATNVPAPVKFTFSLASLNSFANTTNIIIPDHGQGTPYPSTNLVSGLTNITGKVTVTLTNVNHTFPDDIDMLLVGPGGQSVLLMSHAGGSGVLTNTSLTFDDGATNADGTPAFLPASSQILSGSYVPSAYGSVAFPTNTTPAPPYSTNLSVFNGISPNGTWRLFVFDSSPGDQGIIVGGWSLGITTGNEVNPVVDLAVTGKAAPTSILDGANLTYTFNITNNGPNMASVVSFTNTLPANVTLVSATNSAHVASITNVSGIVSCVLTNFATGSNVTVTVIVIPNGAGQLTSTATVSGTENDPNQSNNSATVLTTATAPSADLGVTMTGPTNGVVTSNITYIVTVTNNGPGVALGVVVTNPLNGLALGVGSSSSVLGTTPISSNGVAICNLGNLNPFTTATVTLILTASQAGTITNTATAATASVDAVSTNNSASVVTVINLQAPNIIAAGARLLSSETNGSIAPGEFVSVLLQLANTGTADTTNLAAALLTFGGVTAPTVSRTYGVLVHGGPAEGMVYNFVATGTNNGTISAALQLTDGTNNLGTVLFNFNLPGTNSFANNAFITIPDHGAASPYPSAIIVSNLPGVVSKATVTVSNLSHQFPNDVQILLVAPSGQNVVLMAGVGGGQPVTNVVLTFDDAASASLPSSTLFSVGSGQIVSGTYLPTDDSLAQLFPAPAPGQPYGSALSALIGGVPNGTWSLYVLDNRTGDSGNIAQGWNLNLATVSPVNSASDLGVGLIRPTGSQAQGLPFTYGVSVTNKGPADASDVVLTNFLPAGVTLTGASVAFTAAAHNQWVFNLGSLSAGTTTNFTTTLVSSASGTFGNEITVSADQTDLNPGDNVAQSLFTVLSGPKLSATPSKSGPFALTLSLTGPNGVYNIVASTNITQSLSNWTVLGTITNTTGIIPFTDTNAAGFPRRFYRAVFVP